MEREAGNGPSIYDSFSEHPKKLTRVEKDALLEDVDDLDGGHLGEVLRQVLGLDTTSDVGGTFVAVMVVVYRP